MPTGEFMLNNATVGTFIRNGVIFGVGSSLKENVLWTNPSPSESFSAQNVTLSDAISNYDYIKIVFKRGYNVDDVSSTLMPVSDYKNTANESGKFSGYIGSRVSYTQYRRYYYVDDTTLAFFTNVNGQGTNYDSYSIPLYVIGIKEIRGGSSDITVSMEMLADNINTSFTTKTLKKDDILLLICYGASNTPVASNATLISSMTSGSVNRTFAYRMNTADTSTITGNNNVYRVLRFYTE